MRLHLIAIGGAVMHNLALELKVNGHHISGSDDEIYDPACKRLLDAGLHPHELGWHPSRITEKVDTIVLGMHAHKDNPELIKAQALNLPIYSFPEFFSREVRQKRKIVVCGSHGKTTTTAMIMHVLRKLKFDFDYLVGGMIDGFDRMVKLSKTSEIAVIEGDEYLSSRLDDRPKMLHYEGQIIILTGVAWDHMNVFPTLGSYEVQFKKLLEQQQIEQLIWYGGDSRLQLLVNQAPREYDKIEYHAFQINANGEIIYKDESWPVRIFGQHNMANAQAAMLACRQLGIEDAIFLRAISDFGGVKKRLEKINENPPVYRDFAHAPSKVKASINAVRSQHSERKILALVELHTYSSLSKGFIHQYKGAADKADRLIVYFDPHAVEIKRLEALDNMDIRDAFNHRDIRICSDKNKLYEELLDGFEICNCAVLMSSGNLGGVDVDAFLLKISERKD